MYDDPQYTELIRALSQYPSPSQGSYTKLAANPEADARWARATEMDKAFNQREQDNRLREKLQRAMNAETGARTSGDQKGQMTAMASIENLLRGTGALDARDMEERKVSSNERLTQSLQDLTERQNIRQDERAGKGQELESILTDKRLSAQEKIVALQDATSRRGQDITQSEGRENRGLQQSMAELEQGGLNSRQAQELATRERMQGTSEEGQNNRLDKTIGSQEKMSGDQMANQKFMQALMAGVARGDEEAIRTLQGIMKSGQKSPFSRLLNSLNPFTP
jgi:hypothetical protein